eukprot:Skav222559  [mRNA]  locus=scaffold791:75073:86207:+ [translate_table: standard]
MRRGSRCPNGTLSNQGIEQLHSRAPPSSIYAGLQMASRRCSLVGLALLGLICRSTIRYLPFVGTGAHDQPVTRVVRRAEASAASTYELWADFRLQRLSKAPKILQESCGEVTVSPETGSVQAPKVREGLQTLAKTLREKFEKIGVELPKGKLVNGVVVDRNFAEEVMEEVKDLQIPVYTACKEVGGETMQGNSFFVCKATDGEMDRQRSGKVGYELKTDASDPVKAVPAAADVDV